MVSGIMFCLHYHHYLALSGYLFIQNRNHSSTYCTLVSSDRSWVPTIVELFFLFFFNSAVFFVFSLYHHRMDKHGCCKFGKTPLFYFYFSFHKGVSSCYHWCIVKRIRAEWGGRIEAQQTRSSLLLFVFFRSIRYLTKAVENKCDGCEKQRRFVERRHCAGVLTVMIQCRDNMSAILHTPGERWVHTSRLGNRHSRGRKEVENLTGGGGGRGDQHAHLLTRPP